MKETTIKLFSLLITFLLISFVLSMRSYSATDNLKVDSVKIYILYNKNTGEHLLTSKENEYNKLGDKGWKQEGLSFYAYNKPVKDGVPIYRVYNPSAYGGDHYYTKSEKELELLVKVGWKKDFRGNPVFYGLGDVPVYKAFNFQNGRHHFTRKKGEYDKLGQLGWEQEGTAWMAAKEGDQAEVLED